MSVGGGGGGGLSSGTGWAGTLQPGNDQPCPALKVVDLCATSEGVGENYMITI